MEAGMTMTYNELLIKINEVYGESAKYLYQNSYIKQELDQVDWEETRGIANDYTYECAWDRIKRGPDHDPSLQRKSRRWRYYLSLV